jgi:hypothetical protein
LDFGSRFSGKMKLSSLFRNSGERRSHHHADGAGALGFCPPRRDRSKSLCVPQAMPLIRVETCKEDAIPSIKALTKRRTSMAAYVHFSLTRGSEARDLPIDTTNPMKATCQLLLNSTRYFVVQF